MLFRSNYCLIILSLNLLCSLWLDLGTPRIILLRSPALGSEQAPPRTGIKTGFALQTPALTQSVGASVRTVSSASVGWVGIGNVLLTPNLPKKKNLINCYW